MGIFGKAANWPKCQEKLGIDKNSRKKNWESDMVGNPIFGNYSKKSSKYNVSHGLHKRVPETSLVRSPETLLVSSVGPLWAKIGNQQRRREKIRNGIPFPPSKKLNTALLTLLLLALTPQFTFTGYTGYRLDRGTRCAFIGISHRQLTGYGTVETLW